ncbi:hypothetical protein PRUPE_2G031300 [Prunus persica]|uniref:Uncharacterized protein n=1 Tax=Prunus persica TaxID=3760 RepID=A0A251QAB6_PRUPE|nr:hypothetical protein PRUPE_2G031300 [Prunus persica]
MTLALLFRILNKYFNILINLVISFLSFVFFLDGFSATMLSLGLHVTMFDHTHTHSNFSRSFTPDGSKEN